MSIQSPLYTKHNVTTTKPNRAAVQAEIDRIVLERETLKSKYTNAIAEYRKALVALRARLKRSSPDTNQIMATPSPKYDTPCGGCGQTDCICPD